MATVGLTLAVVGASGATGRHIVAQALARGHVLRVHLRPGLRWAAPPGATEVRSPLDELPALRNLVRGADAVICVLGARPPYRDVFCAEATRRLIEAMRLERADRLLCLTGAMIAPNRARLSWPTRAMAAWFARRRPAVAADRAEQEALVRASALRWTVFKPPRLTDGPSRGRLRVGSGLRIGLRASVTRADLAACMIDAVEHDRHIGKCVYVRSRR